MAAAGEIQLRAQWVAAAMGGAIARGNGDVVFTGVSIDTRSIGAGELYIGIRGERFDGADFASAALEAGAAGVVVPRGRGPVHPGAVVIEVDDTVAALQALANRIRVESGARVVAITGSAGKTTTKEVTAEFLAATRRVIRNRGNFNNHIGLPLSLIELRRRPDVAVVELGMNHAGEISALVRIAEPDVRVWTNVGDAHVGFFRSVDAIADAKAEILECAGASTLLVANADDERVMARAVRFAGRIVTFGIDRDADVRATAVDDRGIEGIGAHVRTAQGTADVQTPLPGRGNLANVLAATAVAIEFAVPLQEIVARAARLTPAAHRGEILRLGRGVTVVDDSYNASPSAVKRALETVSATPGYTRRIAVLGEMLELGEHATALHEEVGRAAAQRVDRLVVVGGEPARSMAAAARAAGLGDRVGYFENADGAADGVLNVVAAGDLVLVKGSRGIRTERVVERLKRELA